MARDMEGVKPGDTIRVNENYGNSFALHTVERVTATRAVCERATFMIESGVQVGTRSSGRWPTSKYGYLVAPSEVPKLQAELDIKRRINIAQIHMSRAIVTSDNLEAAEAFITASKKKESV